METVKVTIEVPKPPDGYEVVGPAVAQEGYFCLVQGGWNRVDRGFFGCVARKKQTLAEWMNAQPDFQVVAKMFPEMHVFSFNCEWQTKRPWPKPPISGEVKSNGEKWIDV